VDSLSTGLEPCRTRSIEHCQVDTLRDLLNGSERFVRTLPSSRGSTSPPQAGGCSSTFGQRPVLRPDPWPGGMWITAYPQVKDERPFKSKSRPTALPFSRRWARRRPDAASAPGGPSVASHRTAGELAVTGPQHHGYSVGQQSPYGIAVTVRASSSLFSLRRCVSKRSPTLKELMFTMDLPARL